MKRSRSKGSISAISNKSKRSLSQHSRRPILTVSSQPIIETEKLPPPIEDLTSPNNDIIGGEYDLVNKQIEPMDQLNLINTSELELSSTDLESVAIIYDKVRQIFKQFIIYIYLKDQ